MNSIFRIASTVASDAKVIQLRSQLRERFPAAHHQLSDAPSFPTSLDLLDDIGIPKAAITEITGRHPGCGIGLLISSLIHISTRTHRHLVLIDGTDSFNPQSPAPSLLWIRCRETEQVPRAADLLLRDGNLPLILIDLHLSFQREVQRIPSSTWFRLRNLAEQSGATLLVFTSTPLIPAAQLRLELSHHFTLKDLERPYDQLLSQLCLQITRQRRSSHFQY